MSLETQSQHGITGLVIHPDGGVERGAVPRREADGITSSDEVIQVSRSRCVGARIFLPKNSRGHLLPIVLYFHGGGFVLFEPASFLYHDWCEKLADHLEVAVVSVDYRLAPEHKLPAAFEDGAAALEWLKQLPPLLAGRVDLSRCYLVGDSAGANIVHNMLLSDGFDDFVKGAVLLQPYFGGEERTGQEVRLRNDKYIPLVANDTLWRLALPEGVSRDCAACNPLINGTPSIRHGLKVMVVVGGRDPMRERQHQYVEAIKVGGGDVRLVEYERGSHGFMVFNKSNAAQETQALLLEELKDFIVSSNRTSKL